MFKRSFYFLFLIVLAQSVTAQTKKAEDSLDYYNDLFFELDGFLDSLTAPRSTFLINVGVSSNFLITPTKKDTPVTSERNFFVAPSVGYFHKSGLGIGGAAFISKEGSDNDDAYQLSLTGSYDYLRNHSFMAGLSYTRFFTPDSISYYTSPLQNETAVYFIYKRGWFKPSVTATYGWGSRTSVEERDALIKAIRSRKKPNNNTSTTTTTTAESISDFTVAASVRHDFYWLNALGQKSSIRLTPQLSLISGTQRFGFNLSTATNLAQKGNSFNVLYGSNSVELDEVSKFQPLSATAFLKSSFWFGVVSLQPQLSLSYYFPATTNPFTTGLLLNAAIAFD